MGNGLNKIRTKKILRGSWCYCTISYYLRIKKNKPIKVFINKNYPIFYFNKNLNN